MMPALLSRSGCLSYVVSVRTLNRFSGKSRKTGRICGNCVLPRQAWRYDVAAGKNFQRMVGKRVGFDTGLDERVLLSSLSQRHRRLDEKKTRQLGNILATRIDEAGSSNEAIGRLGVTFSRVKVNQSFTEVAVSWLCNGQNDDEVASVLDKERHSLRRTLSDVVGTNCPEIRFVPDRMNLVVEEMDRLFKKADYGMDYRAISNTGRILAAVESQQPKAVKPAPKWKQQLTEEK